MCATAGGGFSLMVEAFGFAGVSESAVVVGVFTRPGPATGLPTWTEQSDLRFVLHAAQGEFPRVVLAPGDHTEAFELTWQAFNLADQLQTPVVLLGDTLPLGQPQDLGALRRRCGHDRPRRARDRGRRRRAPRGARRRRRATCATRSPTAACALRALPGVEGADQLVNSYEHDEYGYGAPARRRRSASRRTRSGCASSSSPARSCRPPRASAPTEPTSRSCASAPPRCRCSKRCGWLEREGVAVNLLQVVTVWPFPADEVAAFLDGAKRTLIVEGNATGQLEGLVARAVPARPSTSACSATTAGRSRPSRSTPRSAR